MKRFGGLDVTVEIVSPWCYGDGVSLTLLSKDQGWDNSLSRTPLTTLHLSARSHREVLKPSASLASCLLLTAFILYIHLSKCQCCMRNGGIPRCTIRAPPLPDPKASNRRPAERP